MKPPRKTICKQCGITYPQKSNYGRFCSSKCGAKHRYELRRDLIVNVDEEYIREQLEHPGTITVIRKAWPNAKLLTWNDVKTIPNLKAGDSLLISVKVVEARQGHKG